MRLGNRQVLVAVLAVIAVFAVFAVARPASAAPAPLSPEHADAGMARGVLRFLQDAREEAGSPPLERREALDRVAEKMAREGANGSPAARLSSQRPVAEALRDEGVTSFSQAFERRFVMRSFDPVGTVRRQWEGMAEAWRHVLSTELDGFGAGTAWTEDGYLVLVVLLVEDAGLPRDLDRFARATADAVNATRKSHDLPPLSWDDSLAAVARRHSKDMARRDYLSHESPEGEVVADRVRAAGIEYHILAENLARNRNTTDPLREAVDGWMGSPGHRRNILDGEFTHTGLGVAVGSDGSVYFTQLFLSR